MTLQAGVLIHMCYTTKVSPVVSPMQTEAFKNLTKRLNYDFFQLSQMTEQVRTKADADDEIMIRVNERVEEWKVGVFLITILLNAYFAAQLD